MLKVCGSRPLTIHAAIAGIMRVTAVTLSADFARKLLVTVASGNSQTARLGDVRAAALRYPSRIRQNITFSRGSVSFFTGAAKEARGIRQTSRRRILHTTY